MLCHFFALMLCSCCVSVMKCFYSMSFPMHWGHANNNKYSINHKTENSRQKNKAVTPPLHLLLLPLNGLSTHWKPIPDPPLSSLPLPRQRQHLRRRLSLRSFPHLSNIARALKIDTRHNEDRSVALLSLHRRRCPVTAAASLISRPPQHLTSIKNSLIFSAFRVI